MYTLLFHLRSIVVLIRKLQLQLPHYCHDVFSAVICLRASEIVLGRTYYEPNRRKSILGMFVYGFTFV